LAIHLAADESATGGPAFDIYVPRSFADYLWAWLEDAGREYGVAVVRG
jgi:sarcosine oxidase gamma subunit